MKIFIINLEEDITRKKHMISICNQKKLNYEFIKAIKGSSYKDIQQCLLYKNETFNQIHRYLSKGEIGCILSHRFIFNKIIKENINFALILEDDVNLLPQINKILCFDFNQLNFDIILLGYHGKSRENLILNTKFIQKLDSEISLHKLLENAYGTYGYIVSMKGAKKLLSLTQDFILPIDHYTGDPSKINLFCIPEQIVHINKTLSDESLLTRERKEMIYKAKLLKFEHQITSLRSYINLQNYRLIIYGFNDLGQLVYEIYRKQIYAIVDMKKAGLSFDNKSICDIKDLKNFDFKDTIFVVTALKKEYIIEITKNIKAICQSKIITFE